MRSNCDNMSTIKYSECIQGNESDLYVEWMVECGPSGGWKADSYPLSTSTEHQL